MSFTSVHNHTECSNLRLSDCTIKVPALIDEAVKLGYKGVCITDHEALSGHIKFLQHYQNGIKDGSIPADFRIGLGNEIYLVSEEELEQERPRYWHFILVAKDKEGHRQLRELSSRAWGRWQRVRGMERVPTLWSDLEEVVRGGHLIASTACLGGQFANLVLPYAKGDKSAKRSIVSFVDKCRNIFGNENFFLELQPRLCYNNSNEAHDQVILNRMIPKIADAMGVKYIVTTDSHYVSKADRYVHAAYLQSDPKNSGERELEDFYETTYMMSEEELRTHLGTHLTNEQTEKAISNTEVIYGMLENYDLSHSVIVPNDPKTPHEFEIQGSFAAWYNKYPYLRKFHESPELQDRYLLHLIEKGFIEKGEQYTDETVGRLNEELEIISKVSERLGQPVSAYYVMTAGLVQNLLWKESFVGVARGSATGFYLSYLVGITQISPLPYNLKAWRHLSADRPEMPDIDVDIEANKRPIIFQRMKDYYGKENSLATLTFKTLTSKSAVITACRGLGISDDEAHYLADLIPVERGALWSIEDCIHGNADEGRRAVGPFKNALAEHEDVHLQKTILDLENLITGRSIHASAQYVFSNGYLKQNSLMKAPNGTDITAFNMNDSDVMGGLKVDLLTIKALDKMHAALNALIDSGVIEDKGSIKENYNSYLHPDVLEYDDPAMWKLVGEGAVIDLFQFDTAVGGTGVNKIKPTSIHELTVANAIMRLQAGPGEPSPIDVYCSHKTDIGLWYKEMRDAGLTDEEIAVIEPHLKQVYGVSSLQEEIMLLSMDEKISGFTVSEANKLRKAIAKKKPKLMEEIKELFYKKGSERGTSKRLLDYIWNVQVHYQAGYAFSINHCVPYSIIALQEMNIAHRYGALYWNVGCLTVNAGAMDIDGQQENTEYTKIASAVNGLRSKGQKIELPYINQAKFGFTPDLENNAIIYALKAVNGISDAQSREIEEKQPFDSFEDFLERTGEVVKPASVIALIKSGAFDKIDSRSRQELMRAYLATQANTVTKLTMTHLDELVQRGLVDEEDNKDAFAAMKLYNAIASNVAVKGKTVGKTLCRLGEAESQFFTLFAPYLKEERDYRFDLVEGSYLVTMSALQRAKEKVMAPFKKNALGDPTLLEQFNAARISEYMWEKAPGTTSRWEMDALLYYHGPHELEGVDRVKYSISDYGHLPYEPRVNRVYNNPNRRPYTTYKVTRIAGTVLGREKTKSTVTLLTLDGEVVNVKFGKDAFAKYNQQLSVTDDDGAKHVLEKSWFTRGNKLLITGFRREDQFVARVFHDSIWSTPVTLITGMNKRTGELRLQSERKNDEQYI